MHEFPPPVLQWRMHELGIMESALNTALDHAKKENARAVIVLRLRVGKMTGVIPECLEFAFDSLKVGTLAEGGRLEVEFVTPRFHCPECDREFEVEGISYTCPDCGEQRCTLVAGKELEIVNLDIE